MIRLPLLAAVAMVVATACAAPSTGPAVVRHASPNAGSPIAAAVEVRGDVATVYVSGHVPPNVDPTPSSERPPVYGKDTKAQTIDTLRAIEKTLARLDLKTSDVIKMQVFLVGDPAKGGKMDFAGFMEGYLQFFGTPEQPNRPSRSVFQVVALANPAFLVEIEVVAVRQR